MDDSKLNIDSNNTTRPTLLNEQNIFTVEADLHLFRENEIEVKIIGGSILVVEAKHEERGDSDHGLVSRHFLHRYKLPPNIDSTTIKSQLNNEGILSISAKPKDESTVAKMLPIEKIA